MYAECQLHDWEGYGALPANREALSNSVIELVKPLLMTSPTLTLVLLLVVILFSSGLHARTHFLPDCGDLTRKWGMFI